MSNNYIMSSCQTIDKSIAIYHMTGAAVAGTPVTVPDPDLAGDIYHVMTLINDTDQDIRVSFKTTAGHNNSFIVPKSIKGFTRALKGSTISNTSIMVYSMGGSASGSGSITINLAI